MRFTKNLRLLALVLVLLGFSYVPVSSQGASYCYSSRDECWLVWERCVNEDCELELFGLNYMKGQF